MTDSLGDPVQISPHSLSSIFYQCQAELAVFDGTVPANVPMPYNQLLNHQAHMTVTLEKFHDAPMSVKVVQSAKKPSWYAREILLTVEKSRKVALYGIVRLRQAMLPQAVWREIESCRTPLGRILIQHNVLRQVELCQLWRICAGPALSKHLSIPSDSTLYGRTARIFCDSQPAIELLEVVVDR